MSVRKEYQVLIDSNCVFVGSKAMCDCVFEAFTNFYEVVLKQRGPVILIAYAPDGSKFKR